MRRVFGQFTPEEIYTTKRQLIEDTLEGAVQEVGERFVSIDDLLVLSIELPPTIQQAIQTKLVAEQASLEMQYRISRETQEKERKLIEAEGIQKFNEVVRASLQSTDGNDVTSLLKYRGIDATLELAKSPNTKVIVVGASDRMPLILDAGSAPSSGIASFGSPSYTLLHPLRRHRFKLRDETLRPARHQISKQTPDTRFFAGYEILALILFLVALILAPRAISAYLAVRK
jgi:SPFH domain / Band 7 family